jgi:hypothetical protein
MISKTATLHKSVVCVLATKDHTNPAEDSH